MTRTLATSICFACALGALGCVDRHVRHDYDYGQDARYERHGYYDHHDRHSSYDRWDREDRVDINRASQRQLERLPGLSQNDAERIIANRPYRDADALLQRGVIAPRKYQRIEGYVYASNGRRWRHDDDRRRDGDYEHRRYYDDRRY